MACTSPCTKTCSQRLQQKVVLRLTAVPHPRSSGARLVGSSSAPRPLSGGGAASRLAARASSGGSGSPGSPSNPIDERLVNAALKDPISFLGGIFAGFLALDLQQDPLRTWVQQTASEAGLKYQATVERLEAERRARASS